MVPQLSSPEPSPARPASRLLEPDPTAKKEGAALFVLFGHCANKNERVVFRLVSILVSLVRKNEYEVSFCNGPLMPPLGHHDALTPNHVVDVLEGVGVKGGMASRLDCEYAEGKGRGPIVLRHGDLFVRVFGALHIHPHLLYLVQIGYFHTALLQSLFKDLN
jgi:hypothetical protein